MIPIASLSTSRTSVPRGTAVASIVAAIHPDEPPPTTRIDRMRSARGSPGTLSAVPMSRSMTQSPPQASPGLRPAPGHATNGSVTTGTGDSVAAAGADTFASDWQALRADDDIQFAPITLPEPEPTPGWLKDARPSSSSGC